MFSFYFHCDKTAARSKLEFDALDVAQVNFYVNIVLMFHIQIFTFMSYCEEVIRVFEHAYHLNFLGFKNKIYTIIVITNGTVRL